MFVYRLYFLNGEGRILRALPLECDDDVAAIQVADKQPHRYGLELWQAARLVRRFNADRGASTIS